MQWLVHVAAVLQHQQHVRRMLPLSMLCLWSAGLLSWHAEGKHWPQPACGMCMRLMQAAAVGRGLGVGGGMMMT